MLNAEPKSTATVPEWPLGGSEMAGRIRHHDWASSPLGAPGGWPEHLRAAVQLILDSTEPTCILWTAAGFHLYNDAYRAILDTRHPSALGRSFAQVWPEAEGLADARHTDVLTSGTAGVIENCPYIVLDTRGPRERYFTVYVTPIRGPDAAVDGVLRRLIDTTELTETQRKLRTVVSKLDEQQAGLIMQLALSDAISDESWRQRTRARTELQDREERLRLATVAGRLATWDWDVNTGKVVWSDQMYAMHGYSPDEVEPSFGAWAQRVHADDLPGLLQVLESAMERREEFVHRFRLVHPDGSTHWCSARGRYFQNEPGGTLRMLAVAQDVTEEQRAQQRLRDIEMRQRALIEGVPQLIWRANSCGAWTWSSRQWETYTGLSFNESLGDGWLARVHPDDRERAREAWRNAETAGVFDVEYRIGRSGMGPYRWFQTRATPIRHEENGVIEWLGTSTDVDELRQARERQKLLVAELQHRTRNLLGVIKSLAAMTARESRDLPAFKAQFGERLGALSRAQGLLSRSDEEPITLEALLRVELEALGTSRFVSQITLEGPEVRIRSSVVQTVALAIHELATNALKHGALRSTAGRLTVSWSLRTQKDGNTLQLHWQETGEAAPANPRSHSGYGRELLEQMLPYVLDAKTDYQITSLGARCTIELPVGVDATTGLARIGAAQ
jgi:PAS domain S-box-containing protein